MTIFTIDEINAQLEGWKKALTAVSTGQEYSVAGRKLTRADLPEIRKTLEWLNREKDKIEKGGSAVVRQGRVAR